MSQPQLNINNTHNFNPVILRAYDIRGIVGESLFKEDAYYIGRSLATLLVKESGKEPAKTRIAVGRDGRLSSPELEAALVQGIVDAGVEAVRVGLGPSPMLYYAVKHLHMDGGVMVTGSHNPPTHNGFKMLTSGRAFFGQDIINLGRVAAEGSFLSGKGNVTETPVIEDYVRALLEGFNATSPKPLKVVWDAGNGAAGEVIQKLTDRLAGEHILLNEEIDGTFPAHHPDPTEEKNLVQLINTVKAERADIGVAFDGDGDRIGAVDAKGRILWGDQLMMLYAKDVLETFPNATIIADVKASQSLFDTIKKLGGNPIIWKTGHSFIKSKIAETGAKLAGEMSGHIFFADRYYGFDDGIYSAVRLVNLVAKAEESLVEMMDALPQMFNTPELRIDVAEERKFEIIKEVADRLKKAGIAYSDIDGVRVMTEDGWWLLRASNTQAVLVARAEAGSKESLEILKNNIKNQLEQSGQEFVLSAGH